MRLKGVLDESDEGGEGWNDGGDGGSENGARVWIACCCMHCANARGMGGSPGLDPKAVINSASVTAIAASVGDGYLTDAGADIGVN